MKTTIDIAASLLEAAKKAAADERTTLRALIEEGLRTVLNGRHARMRRFKLRDASFKGKGLRHGVSLTDRDAMAREIYEGRGG